MSNLYSVATQVQEKSQNIGRLEAFSVLYHDIFDFPLSLSELIRWTPSKNKLGKIINKTVVCKNGHFFVEGKEGLVYKKILRKRISQKKIHIAKQTAKVLSIIPSVKFVGLTGSLAMENATSESDIDLLIVTQNGRLWSTRLFTYFLLYLTGKKTRKAGIKEEKDRLCLNIWLDESDMSWKNKNFYTAHEIAQVVPLTNKKNTYEKFLQLNSWIQEFWPNAVRIPKKKYQNLESEPNLLFRKLEKISFAFQWEYMRNKITREEVNEKRAIFHPQDFSKFVLDRV